MATLGANCYAVWTLPDGIIDHARGADGSLTSEVLGIEVMLSIIVERIHERDILTEEANYVTRDGNGMPGTHWTGIAPTRDDGETWDWPYPQMAQPAADQFEFIGRIVKRSSFQDVGGLKIAFNCVWTFHAFVANPL